MWPTSSRLRNKAVTSSSRPARPDSQGRLRPSLLDNPLGNGTYLAQRTRSRRLTNMLIANLGVLFSYAAPTCKVWVNPWSTITSRRVPNQRSHDGRVAEESESQGDRRFGSIDARSGNTATVGTRPTKSWQQVRSGATERDQHFVHRKPRKASSSRYNS